VPRAGPSTAPCARARAQAIGGEDGETGVVRSTIQTLQTLEVNSGGIAFVVHSSASGPVGYGIGSIAGIQQRYNNVDAS
jgi:hypothetical protein